MNTLLWIFQGILAFVFITAGFVKLSKPKAEVEKRMAFAEDFSTGTIKFIGLMELLGGLGVVLPMLLDVVPILTPISAAGLALIQILAAFVHRRRKERVMVAGNVILLVLAAMVAASRF
jgi:uncharacterized membrane protein YphA (DoxX/SURF4 family)